MKFNKFFKEKTLPFNGQIVELSIIHISQHNHPLGPIGTMLMGNQQTERVQLAVNHYKGVDALIKLNAKWNLLLMTQQKKLFYNKWL